MTILTALRTAATSAVAAKYLARPGSRSMAIIGNGAQSEFQALGFKALIGVDRLRLYDIDRWASEKCAANLARYGFDLTICASVEDAVEGVDIVTTVTADKQYATMLTDNHGRRRPAHQRRRRRLPGQDRAASRHPAALGDFRRIPAADADRRRDPAAAARSSGDRAVAGDRRRGPGRRSREQITLFDSVGFAIEDFSALRYVHSKLAGGDFHEDLDLLADPDEPRDLLGMVHRAQRNGLAAAS